MNAIISGVMGVFSNLTVGKVIRIAVTVALVSMAIAIYVLTVRIDQKDVTIGEKENVIVSRNNTIIQKDKDIKTISDVNDHNVKQLEKLENVVLEQQNTQKRIDELSSKLTKVKNQLDKSISDLNYGSEGVNYEFLTPEENRILIEISIHTTS